MFVSSFSVAVEAMEKTGLTGSELFTFRASPNSIENVHYIQLGRRTYGYNVELINALNSGSPNYQRMLKTYLASSEYRDILSGNRQSLGLGF